MHGMSPFAYKSCSFGREMAAQILAGPLTRSLNIFVLAFVDFLPACDVCEQTMGFP